MTRTTTLTLTNLPPPTTHSTPSTIIASTRFASPPSKPQYARYPSAPSLPYTALPSPILSNPLLDATEPFPEYIETMADFPDPANTLPPSAAAASAGFASQHHTRTPLWERILSPLLFISFILGLYVVDSSNRDRTTSSLSYGSSASSDWDDLSAGSAAGGSKRRTKAEKSGGRKRKASVTSRASVASSTASMATTSEDDDNDSQAAAPAPWFWRAKRRRIAKMEIVAALEWRGTVAALLVGLVIAACALAWWTGRSVWQVVVDSEHGAGKMWARAAA